METRELQTSKKGKTTPISLETILAAESTIDDSRTEVGFTSNQTQTEVGSTVDDGDVGTDDGDIDGGDWRTANQGGRLAGPILGESEGSELGDRVLLPVITTFTTSFKMGGGKWDHKSHL